MMHAPLAAPILFGLFQFDDPLGLLFALVLIGTGFVALLCALGTPNEASNAMMVLLFCAAGTLLVFTTHLFLLYILWEVAAFAAWGLGRISTRGTDAIMGALPWQGAGGLGSISMFSAVLLLTVESRGADLSALTTGNSAFVTVLILLGVLMKSLALFSHAWHDGQPYTSSLTSGLLAGGGVLVIGLYPFFRLYNSVLEDVTAWRTITPYIVVPVALIAGLGALGGRDLPSIISYVALNQWALLLLNVVRPEPGMLTVTLVQSVIYAFIVLLLFACVGMVIGSTIERDIRYLGGLGMRMPFTATLFLLASLAMVGIPPFSSFLSRLLAASELDFASLLGRSLLEVLVMLALLRVFYHTFLGKPAVETEADDVVTVDDELNGTNGIVVQQSGMGEVSPVGLLTVAASLAGLIWISLEPGPLFHIISLIATHLQA